METSSLVLILFCASFVRVSVRGQSYGYEHIYASTTKQYTRQITLKQGVLQGIVVEPRVNHALSPVEQYLGIPYAAPPVGELRFMPSGSSPSWFGVKYADQMGPVCPQKFPNRTIMEEKRKKYFDRLVKYLLNQSEDCLYLNIYAPLQDFNTPHSKKHPVMVFIHGESFEWNSGNPYDGSVLASYGEVIVVTLNYRLGILGFLKVGLDDNSSSNFGLVDQVAALLWVQENIAAFGGDPNSVTLFGHGTGAACISLLMLSPMVAREQKPLFHRAILMSGTALSDWALASTSRQVTYQVAESLNCPSDEKLAGCLRKKNLREIMDVGATTRDYMTRFGPIIDGLVVPNDPNKIMSSYNDFFTKFELMYGLTEVESVHLLDPVALTYGLLEKERDQELRKYLYTRCEYKPELYLAHALEEYTRTERMGLGEQMQAGFTGHEPDRASVARDTLLDMLSDARSAAPIALTAKYHSAVNPQSYFYVFGHTTASRDFIRQRNKTTHGEELPYVFGAPLDGPKFHFTDHYNNQERLFSEVVMKLWCNFAFSGDPNIKRRNGYLTLNPDEWIKYEVNWPEYNTTYERYLYLAIPPDVRNHYRSKEIHFWNTVLPSLLTNHTNINNFLKPTPKPFPHFMKSPPKSIPPWFPFGRGTSTDRFRKPPEKKPSNDVAFGTVKLRAENVEPPSKPEFGTVVTSPSQTKSGGTAMIVLIAVGGIFLVINVILFVGLYYKCSKLKHTNTHQSSYDNPVEESGEKQVNNDDNGCSLMKIITKSSRSGDTYEAVKISEDGSSKYKLSRQISASTIDPHTKVRDWIAQEIAQKCSPKFLRRSKNVTNLNKDTNSSSTIKSRNEVKSESLSTLGKSPTRPVSLIVNDDSRMNIPQVKTKVSVAIDATPAARSPSVLRQQPIELTKSLDCPDGDKEMPLRRSATLDNFFEGNISVQFEPTIVKIEHHHVKSRSEPAKDSNGDPIYACPTKNLKSFDPNYEINVTSKNDNEVVQALTPEESLQTIKRRNFPKVLPDYPDKNYMANKRRSMPASSFIYATLSDCKPQSKQPPPPPPRVCSTLGRKANLAPVQQPPIMAKEPPLPEEPEITCNNLYIGPLLPKILDLNTYPIYDNLRKLSDTCSPISNRADKVPKTIITTDPYNPIIKKDSKIIIKPNLNKGKLEGNANITRVIANDNLTFDKDKVGDKFKHIETEEMDELKGAADITVSDTDNSKPVRCRTPSQIPKLIKTPSIGNILSKGSSSESTPSDDSETGTIIKRV